MTAPNYQAIGTAVQGTGTLSPAWPSHQADDIGLLLVTTFALNNNVPTLSTPAGFSTAFVSDSTFAGFGSYIRVSAFWCRATSGAMSAPTLADDHDNARAVILTVRGGITSGDPYDVTSVATGATGTTATIDGATTTLAEELVIVAIGTTTTSSSSSAWTNVDLTGITERLDSSGAQPTLHCATATADTAKTYGSTTATVAYGTWAGITVALKPVAAATGSKNLLLLGVG